MARPLRVGNPHQLAIEWASEAQPHSPVHPAPSPVAAALTYPAAPVIAGESDIDHVRAIQAYAGTSFTPEDRAKRDRAAYVEDVNGLYAELWQLAKSDSQKDLLAKEMERYRQGYLERLKAYHASHANVASAMIVGPARFPVARMEKHSRWAEAKLRDWAGWRDRGRDVVKQKLLDSRTPDEKLAEEWKRVAEELEATMARIAKVDSGQAAYTRTAITNSIAGKIERLARAGNVAMVERSLAWLKQHNDDSGKPAFTERHHIWTLAEVAADAAGKQATTANLPDEKIAESVGISLWSCPSIERAQLRFTEKPSFEMRERLKRESWKWAPSNQAWQRKLTRAALVSGTSLLEASPSNDSVKSSPDRAKGEAIPLPSPSPCADSIAAGQYGRDDDGLAIHPESDEIQAITEALAERLIDLLGAISQVQLHEARKNFEGQFEEALALYGLEFGAEAAAQLEAHVREQASLIEQPGPPVSRGRTR